MGRIGFLVLILLAAILSEVPWIGLPLKWVETFFHEISHGLAAIVTGGRIVRFELFADGSGLCYNAGGWRIVVAFAGYAGASLWGLAVYRIAREMSPKAGPAMAASLAILIGLSWVFWGSGGQTAILTGVIMAIFALAAVAGRLGLAREALAFIGVSIAVSAIRAPLVLLFVGGASDARTLADITFIPRILWIAAWSAFSAYVLYRMWRMSPRKSVTS